MSPGHENGIDPLDENVARLLSRTPPERILPPEAKQRILSALTEQAAGGARDTTTSWKRPASWAAAAAAVLVVALLALWPGGMQSGLAWADVAQHFAEVKSVIAWVVVEATPPSGKAQVTRARLIQKDPGWSRTETFSSLEFPPPSGEPVPPEAIDAILIMTRSPVESTIARLYPKERRAQLTTLSFSGNALEERERTPRDLVAGMWVRLQGLTEDQTRLVGERTIDGEPAVGFAASLKELLGASPTVPPDGTVRVWASRETAVPLEVEVELVDPAGTVHRTTYGPIEWNAPVAGDLFVVPDLDGWEVVNEEVREIGFSRTSLATGVTLRIGPAGGPEVMTEEDVAAVLSARSVLAPGATSPRVTIFLSLTPASAERVRAYTTAHRGESLLVDFNGEARYEIRIGGVIGAEMRIDVSALELTPERFEETYLAD